MPLGTLTPIVAARTASVEALAARFAGLATPEAEALIERYVEEAIAQWRVEDATFWQRVKFRARLLRAAGRHSPTRLPLAGRAGSC